MTSGAATGKSRRKWWVIAPPFLWFLILFLVPFLIVFRISLSQKATAQPPYLPVFQWSDGVSGWWQTASQLTVENYRSLFFDPLGDSLYLDAYLTSLRIAAIGTALTLLVAYPLALAIARAPKSSRSVLLMLVILPFWTSFLIRVYALNAILKPEGFLNAALMGLGAIREPLIILNTEAAIFIGIVYCYLPFMVLPIYAAIERQDPALLEAAGDLGANPLVAFWQITLPLSLPGVIAACLLVFIPVMGEFVIPDLLGGPETLMIGTVLWDEFFRNRDWPLASAVAVVLVLILLVPIMVQQQLGAPGKRRRVKP
jgi:putrescine transport system permease protein